MHFTDNRRSIIKTSLNFSMLTKFIKTLYIYIYILYIRSNKRRFKNKIIKLVITNNPTHFTTRRFNTT